MKVKRTGTGGINGKSKAVLSISRREWIRLGQEAGWEISEIAEEALQDEGPLEETFNIDVTRYGDRTWAVYLNGDLLCVTVYKKGAEAVRALIGYMASRIQDAEGGY